jgi:hypothetical protein
MLNEARTRADKASLATAWPQAKFWVGNDVLFVWKHGVHVLEWLLVAFSQLGRCTVGAGPLPHFYGVGHSAHDCASSEMLNSDGVNTLLLCVAQLTSYSSIHISHHITMQDAAAQQGDAHY